MFQLPGVLRLTVTFLSTMFTDDYVRLSRPVYYVLHDVEVLDGAPHSVQLYLDASGEHALNHEEQQLGWKEWATDAVPARPAAAAGGSAGGSAAGGSPVTGAATTGFESGGAALRGVQIGVSGQKVLGSKGDRCNIDWGYLHMAAAAGDASVGLAAGSVSASRQSFLSSGALPTTPDTRKPRAGSDDLAGLATTKDLGAVSNTASHTVRLAATPRYCGCGAVTPPAFGPFVFTPHAHTADPDTCDRGPRLRRHRVHLLLQLEVQRLLDPDLPRRHRLRHVRRLRGGRRHAGKVGGARRRVDEGADRQGGREVRGRLRARLPPDSGRDQGAPHTREADCTQCTPAALAAFV